MSLLPSRLKMFSLSERLLTKRSLTATAMIVGVGVPAASRRRQQQQQQQQEQHEEVDQEEDRRSFLTQNLDVSLPLRPRREEH